MKSERLARRVEALNKIVITPQIQQNDFDCGQTVLDMLGYQGHELFPDCRMSRDMLVSLPNVKSLPLRITEEEKIDYSTPKVWIFLPKEITVGSENHWVIRYGNDIYCPTLGKANAQEYKQKYVAFVLQVYEVPVMHKHRSRHPGKKSHASETVEVSSEKLALPSPTSQNADPEFGSQEWAEWVARTIGQYDAEWWYNSPAAQRERELKKT